MATIALGLVSRSSIFELPMFIATYAGDTLWALLVFWLLRLLKPSGSTYTSAALALLFSFIIEFSQLYHAQWIDDIRMTVPGSLVLGSGFLLSDLVCYSVGIIAGLAFDLNVLMRHCRTLPTLRL